MIRWTRGGLYSISKTREIGLGAHFLGWLASRHSGWVELQNFSTAFLLHIFLTFTLYSLKSIDWCIFCDFRHLFRGTAKFSEVKILYSTILQDQLMQILSTL